MLAVVVEKLQLTICCFFLNLDYCAIHHVKLEENPSWIMRQFGFDFISADGVQKS